MPGSEPRLVVQIEPSAQSVLMLHTLNGVPGAGGGATGSVVTAASGSGIGSGSAGGSGSCAGAPASCAVVGSSAVGSVEASAALAGSPVPGSSLPPWPASGRACGGVMGAPLAGDCAG